MKKPTNDKEFEAMIRNCAEIKYQTDFILLGRKGQAQHGGDVASADMETIIQCKCYEENRGRRAYYQLISKIKGSTTKKGDYEKACAHFEQMRLFVVATTLGRDEATQKTVHALEKKYRDNGFRVPIRLLFWEDIEPLYKTYEEKYKLAEIRHELGRVFQVDRDSNPSFTLMQIDKIDRHLLPGLEGANTIAPLNTQAEGPTEPRVSPVWGKIRDTWKADENRSIVIQGVGGIGKTVTLFSLTEVQKEYEPAPAIYIPVQKLIDINHNYISVTSFLQAKYPRLYVEIDQLARCKWIDGPKLLLLLDGFNEVPGAKRATVLSIINEWGQAHPGAQLIAVSRPMDNINLLSELVGRPVSIKLKPLSKDIARSYLTNAHIVPPPDESPVWKDLVIPLFLVLYLKTGQLKKQANSGYKIFVREANTGGAIIWNYLQRELLKTESEEWVIYSSIACEYIIPHIAYLMLSKYQYSITQEEVESITIDVLRHFDAKRLPLHLQEIISTYQRFHPCRKLPVSVATDKEQEKWCEFVLRESGILVPCGTSSSSSDSTSLSTMPQHDSRSSFSFIHQNFRDCLAGLNLVNIAEMIDGLNVPENWKHRQNKLALNYAAELFASADPFIKLWEANRIYQVHHVTHCIYNLLEVYMHNTSLASALDFSGMQLRDVSLVRYLGKDGIKLPLFNNSDLSVGAVLNSSVFRSIGHSEQINFLTIVPNERVVSGSTDHALRVWDSFTGQCLWAVSLDDDVCCFTVLPNGLVVSCSTDKSLDYNWLEVWDITTNEDIHRESIPTEATFLMNLPNGYVAIGFQDKSLQIWDVSEGKCLQSLKWTLENGHLNFKGPLVYRQAN